METLQLWETETGSKDTYPTYVELIKFLETRFRILETLQHDRIPKPQSITLPSRNTNTFFSNTSTCVKCKQNHHLFHCEKFHNLSINNRLEFVKQHKLCKNCLSTKHSIYDCASKKTCRICNKRHNTLLHLNQIHAKPDQHPNTSQSQASQQTKASQSFFTQQFKQALLSTAMIQAQGPSGHTIILRALIDSGSDESYITEHTCKRLKLNMSHADIYVSGLGDTQTAHPQSKAALKIKSIHSTFQYDLDAFVLPRITNVLPTQKINISNFNHIKNLTLADPKYYEPHQIDILLGVKIYAAIIEPEILRINEELPVAQNTKLGWILMGTASSHNNRQEVTTFFNQPVPTLQEINTTLKRFWEIEDIPTTPKLTTEEQQCEKSYLSSYTRHNDGHYSVLLPFKQVEGPDLGLSRPSAIAQFLNLEKRFAKDLQYFTLYKECINEYLTLGHMKEIIPEKTNCCNKIQHYYMPHHGVLKESSTTTKLRVVFNASCKSTNGKSLNEQMLIGPTIQSTLWTTLLRWRNYKYAFTADIEKMYRMIAVQPEHQKYQRIIWRNSPNEPLKDYELTTVTFGTAAAPYLAIRTLHQLAEDEAKNYPEASQQLLTQTYVDDVTGGHFTIEGAIKLQKDLNTMLHKGGFKLRKWTANDNNMLEHIPLEHRELKQSLEFSDTTTIKTLGIQWYPKQDVFGFKIKLPELKKKYTKRKILSEVATLFDPFGWLAPNIIKGKIIIQRLWRSGCSWDEEAPQNLTDEWITMRQELKNIEKIKIPRWTKFTPTSKSIEIHGFADASNVAYAAAVYLKIQDEMDKFQVTLCAAKTKVAPVKQITLPRLELCGALLLSKLIKQIQIDLKLLEVPVFAWTDSQVTLAWIKGQPTKWKPFVANRVFEILENTQPSDWNYVSTHDNPADCASRGITTSQLIEHTLWWQGPAWLKGSQIQWPKQPTISETENEKRKVTTLTSIPHPDFLEKYSNFNKLKRIIAYCCRFIHNCKHKAYKETKNYLTVSELNTSEKLIIKIIQNHSFTREISHLKTKKPLHNNSKLLTLNPFLDKEGILRVGGRLHNSTELAYESKHPAILPNTHYISKLIIDNIHKYTLHGGTQIVLNTLRNKYWLLNARNTIRYQLHHCVICFKNSPKPGKQIMSDLPACRTNTNFPFQHTGVDYAGPINIKTSKIRSAKCIKGYICIFVCMATKAVHIEAVTDLTAESFLAAFRRFISRRGRCSHVYSDCGTNFVKANKLLLKNAQENYDDITWHFNPPAAPNFGGLWEAGVKSAKRHLQTTFKDTTLTYEELSTALAQIEACLNSRPIIPLTNDPESHNLLTPGHFLTGRNIILPPENSNLNNDIPLKRWQYIQHLTKQFWKKWSQEYLHQLQQRYKWQKIQSNLQVNDLVIIKDDNLSSTKWPLGKIIQIIHGNDGNVRVAHIKTNSTTVIRPISKICKLPVQ